MDKQRGKKFRKTLIVLGSSIIALSNGLTIYWGNLTIYVHSYFLSCLDSDSYSQTPWIISVFLMIRTLSLLLHTPIQKALGKRWTPVGSILIASLGMLLSYFSVQMSVTYLVLTLAVLFGFGTGTMTAWTLQLLGECADNDLGFLSSVITSINLFGAMAMNEFVTAYINPYNRQADFYVREYVYFTQRDVVDKVPSTFVILGVFTLASETLGFGLIKFSEYFSVSDDDSVEENNSACDGGGQTRNDRNTSRAGLSQSAVSAAAGSSTVCTDGEIVGNSSQPFKLAGRAGEDSLSGERTGLRWKNNDLARPPAGAPVESTNDETTAIHSDAHQNSDMNNEHTPQEVLKSRIFYAVWTAFIFAELPFLFTINYFKVFGQLWVHDDHFLTFVGSARAVGAITGRILAGIAMDKVGIKIVIRAVLLFVTITLTWHYFAAMANRWLYLALSVLLSNIAGAYFHCYLGVAAWVFGRKHIATNLGLLKSASLVVNFSAPLLFEFSLIKIGWLYTFVITSVLPMISLVLMSIFLPNV